jgi:hypothetical protein
LKLLLMRWYSLLDELSGFPGLSLRKYLIFQNAPAVYLPLPADPRRADIKEAVMHIIFEPRHPDAAALRPLAVHRVRFALRRLDRMVPRARVRLSDVNGPRGGIDKLCQVELHTPQRRVVTSSRAAAWRDALDLALQRAARVLARSLKSRRAGTRAAAATPQS